MKTKELWTYTIDKPTEPNLNLTNQVLACAFLKGKNIKIIMNRRRCCGCRCRKCHTFI